MDGEEDKNTIGDGGDVEVIEILDDNDDDDDVDAVDEVDIDGFMMIVLLESWFDDCKRDDLLLLRNIERFIISFKDCCFCRIIWKWPFNVCLKDLLDRID